MNGAWLGEWDPPPEVFATVMATGIVSVAADDHGYWRLGIALGMLAVVTFAILGLRSLVWVIRRPAHVVAVTRDLDVALRMFTFIAACAVLAVRWGGHSAVGWLFGGLALAAWLVLVPLAVVDVGSWPGAQLREQAHGAWLLPSVAAAGLATTATDLAIDVRAPSLVVIAALAWIAGMAIYLTVTWLIAWRALATPIMAEEVTPDSWILMGALAITALAGDHILAAARALSAPAGLAGWARPVTLGAWVLASLWIPALLYAQVWRVDQVVGSLRYQGAWWTAVFPLGMYSAASAATATELHMRSLGTVSLVFFWDAFTVWTLLVIGGLHSAVAHKRHLPRRAPRRRGR
ncbi:MAG: tellurite resistance/C4-dicarboxylate transporter family protein [Pseudonocardiales bacterium]|nr:tellurite resistance/C4-dicarboxylate transporter family protein [Pseudonocardiales bacterium]MBV9029802.1 tellurite resistance/C4-dicarboxylate transporter family protein [Pseudonocardiales bacterium]